METPKKVFCSHRGVDHAAVKDFAAKLREAGIDAWLDEWEIAPGDSIVACMNEGLSTCDVGLVFFSSAPWLGKWFENEVECLTVLKNERGVRVIPVMLDDGAPIPALLLPLARRPSRDFQQIVDAIRGVDRKPKLGPTLASRPTLRFTLRLLGPTDGNIELVALGDGVEVAREAEVRLSRPLQQSYAEFLHGQAKDTVRGPVEAARQSLERAVEHLGTELGQLLFPNAIGDAFMKAVESVHAGSLLELCFEATDTTLLALPFEATRVRGVRPALEPGVRIRRIVRGVRPLTLRSPASPLKVLVAVGAPDEHRSANAVLDLEHELQGILDAVAPRVSEGNVEVRFLEVGHPDEIAKALSRDEYHVLHLAGHGAPGTIELEDEDGAPLTVTARALSDAIKRSGRNVPLVFLSSCHGGTTSSETTSLAVGLVQEGLPLVLSMQTRVTDRYASDLARVFYEELVQPELPLASQALASARQKLESARLKRLLENASAQEAQPEFATASLVGAEEESPLVDYAATRVPLRSPAVHRLEGPVPQLQVGELVGRRSELRALLRVLRDHPASVAEVGKKAGVVLTGIGGVGKSSLAGRAMVRLKEQGWVVAAITGPLNLTELTRSLGEELSAADGPLSHVGRALLQADERTSLRALTRLLQTERLLLVLDNFEDNLEVGGGDYLASTTAAFVEQLARVAVTGKLLLTSRYPIPTCQAYFAELALGPLSRSETRKLFLRLPGLGMRLSQELEDVMQHVGGHPRMLEFLDGILRKGHARLPAVSERLRRLAREEQVPLKGSPGALETALAQAIRVGARDILLDELLHLAKESGDTEVLLQCAVSALPMDAAGVAQALGEAAPPLPSDDVEQRLNRLVDLSLVTRTNEREYWLHRWTADALKSRETTEQHQARCLRAGRYRMGRVDAAGQGSLADAMEATRNFLEAHAFDLAASEGLAVARFLSANHQTSSAAAFASECLRHLPEHHDQWPVLADLEANSLQSLGFTELALTRSLRVRDVLSARAQAEPDRADFQRDLSVSFERLGDLMRALGKGDDARQYFENSLAIRQRLAQAEPDRADFQRDLSVSFNKLGDLMVALGKGDDARQYFENSLAIAQRLALAEPDRADFQRDLSVSFNKLGDLMVALGKGDDARQYFEKDLAIAQRLALAEPDRADFQRDLLVSLHRMMVVDPTHADSHRAAARDILRDFRARGALVADMAALERAFGIE